MNSSRPLHVFSVVSIIGMLTSGCSPVNTNNVAVQQADQSSLTSDPQQAEMGNLSSLRQIYEAGIDKMQAGKNDEGVRDVTEAADGGLPEAQIMLGFFYNLGKDVPKDTTKAIALWEKAAAHNSPMGNSAFIYLGETYEDGEDVPQDYSKAMFWYRKGVDLGNPMAEQHLGAMYELGHGTPLDLEEAAKLYQKAAANGNADAQSGLAFMYFKGEGVPQNYLQAKDYAQKAALQGNNRAQFLMGTLHVGGVPSNPTDYVEAYAWFSIAKAGGIEEASDLLQKLSAEMTSEQITDAQKLSSDYYGSIQANKGVFGS